MLMIKAINLVKERIAKLNKEIDSYEDLLGLLEEMDLEDDLEERKKHGDQLK